MTASSEWNDKLIAQAEAVNTWCQMCDAENWAYRLYLGKVHCCDCWMAEVHGAEVMSWPAPYPDEPNV